MQVISHRGYKAKFPENTSLGFENAYKAGADAIETDVQVTKDGVMVINHDASTGRSYNKDLTIVDSTSEELKKSRTINGDQQILTLEESLHWLLEHRDTKLLSDVKPLLPKIAMVKIYTMMLRVSEDVSFWHEHVMWGLWSVDWVEYGVETGVLKHFDVVAITLSSDVARKFVDFFKESEDDNYNLLSISVHFVSTWTEQFRFEILPISKRERIQLFVWTVNNIIDVKYLNQYSVDPQMIGIVTDDPQEAKEVLVPAFKPLPTTEKKSDFVAFKAPKWTTKDGFRFHSYLIIYQFVTALSFSSWFRKEFVPGYSIASLMFMFLRSIHFI